MPGFSIGNKLTLNTGLSSGSGLSVLGNAIGGFSPAALFADSEPGFWYDPSDLTTMFQDRAGTTPVTAAGQTVGMVLDKSGHGNHLTANSDATQGIYGVEPLGGRRNLYERTDDFGNAYWTKTALTVSPDAIAVSSGLAGAADKITEAAITTTHIVYKTTGLSVGAGTYTGQVKAKAGERSRLLMSIYNGSNDEMAQFDLAGGTVVQEFVPGMASITNLGNGEYLCTVTRTIGAATSYLTFGPHTSSNVGNLNPPGFTAYAGDGASGIYVWDVQFELSATPTAYQKVVTALEVTEAGKPSLGYILFDGTDDGYVSPTITPGTDKAQVFAGVRNLSDMGLMIAELGGNIVTVPGSLYLVSGTDSGGTGYTSQARGTAAASINLTAKAFTFSAPDTAVIATTHDIAGDLSTIRRNGVAGTDGTADKGTGNFLAYPLYVGRRGGTTLPFNGRLYSLIGRFGPTLPDATIASTETWVNTKTGAY